MVCVCVCVCAKCNYLILKNFGESLLIKNSTSTLGLVKSILTYMAVSVTIISAVKPDPF